MITETERLTIRNWDEKDRDLFFKIFSDDTVMEFFPYRRSREETDVIFDQIQKQIAETGYGFYAVALKSNDEAIGFCGLNDRYSAPVEPVGTPEIGWRLNTPFWGKGYVTEAANALLNVAFTKMELEQIVAFAVANNHRSTSVMKRIGMTYDPDADFDHPKVPDTHPKLKKHVLYRIKRENWRAAQTA